MYIQRPIALFYQEEKSYTQTEKKSKIYSRAIRIYFENKLQPEKMYQIIKKIWKETFVSKWSEWSTIS